jgi:hypothetical protein
MRRARRWTGFIAALILVMGIPASGLSEAGTKKFVPFFECTDLGSAELCTTPWSQEIELTKVQEVVDRVLGMKTRKRKALIFMWDDTFKVFGFFNERTGAIYVQDLTVKYPGSMVYATLTHELWHFLLHDEGLSVYEHHCELYKNAAFYHDVKRWWPSNADWEKYEQRLWKACETLLQLMELEDQEMKLFEGLKREER